MNIACLLFNLSREVFQELIFHAVLLTLVVSFQHLQPCHINVQVHLFLDERITGTQRLDLRIGQSLLVHIVTGANWRFGGHNLRNELLLVLQGLIQICVEGSLCHILIHLHFFVLIALTDDTTVSLGHIGRTPPHIQVVNCNQFVLDVGSCTHLCGTTKQHTHLTGTNLGKEVFFLCFGVCIMDECDFLRRYSVCNQLRFNVIVDIERTIILRSGEVTEHKLSQLICLTILPDAENISHTGIQFAVRVIGEQWVHQSLIQT